MARNSRPGVSAVVFDDDGRVLLVQREDFRTWTLPGGGIEAGETLEAAAVREVEEETGYQIRVERLVGRYIMPDGHEVHCFAGLVVGGRPIRRGPETWALGWFPPEQRPWPFSRRVAWKIEDALADHSQPVVRVIEVPLQERLLRKLAVAIRDTRNRLFRRRSRT